MFKRIPGTKDILPDEVSRWQALESAARSVFALYNFAEIRPPLIEEAALFNRSLGTTTEIVQKQMFLIPHQEDTYALRPEGTASIVRAYIENNLDKKAGITKVFYIGPMFRRERPQKGRLRQFHHIGCEVIGGTAPELDAEVIALARHLLDVFGVSGYRLLINSLGCADDKKNLAEFLRQELSAHLKNLCEDCATRFNTNVLRILDCKQEQCKAVVNGLDMGRSHRCDACNGHFNAVKESLDALGVPYEVAPRLVRGLDYYTRTVFEMTHADLGAQDAIGAGGRYDKLVVELGGADAGAIGFAFGVERVLMACSEREPSGRRDSVFVAALGDAAKKETVRLMSVLRSNGIACDTDYQGRSLKGAMRLADDQRARWVAIIGDNELEKKSIMLKDLESGEQREIPAADCVREILARAHEKGS